MFRFSFKRKISRTPFIDRASGLTGGTMKEFVLPYRLLLYICALLLAIIAVLIALGVIPPVKADTYPGVKHAKVVTAFWINISLNLLSAFVFFFIAIRSKERSWKSTSVLIITGLLVIILGIALADAGSAYQKHGTSMQSASIILFFCAAVDFLTGVTIIITAFLRPKKIQSA